MGRHPKPFTDSDMSMYLDHFRSNCDMSAQMGDVCCTPDTGSDGPHQPHVSGQLSSPRAAKSAALFSIIFHAARRACSSSSVFCATAPSMHASMAAASMVRSRWSCSARARTMCAEASRRAAHSTRHAEIRASADAGDEVIISAYAHACRNDDLERFPPDVNHFVPNGIPYLQQIRFSLRNHWGRGRSWPRAIRQI
jgi:hypothetical protein